MISMAQFIVGDLLFFAVLAIVAVPIWLAGWSSKHSDKNSRW